MARSQTKVELPCSIEYVPERDLPASAGNQLYLDYIAGAPSARRFYGHGPLDFTAALAERQAVPYPRARLAHLLEAYNAGLGAAPEALAGARDLADSDTYCVIGGSQVGFLGGPVYTTYKIVAIIRLARRLEEKLGVRVVPAFWLASEDHDFQEVNHVYYLQPDGEVGRVRFTWNEQGKPISALPLTPEAQRAANQYFAALEPGPHRDETRALFAPRPGETYTSWHGRVWADLFSPQGLVLVQPEVLRPLAGDFFGRALQQAEAIATALAQVAGELRQYGYQPQLTSADAGRLYLIDERGRRLRVDDAPTHVERARRQPEHYSTDAALRPVFADAVLPVLADVLGAGEIAYQGMLQPLHGLFDVPQPVLFPRPHYTVVGPEESQALERYGVTARDILTAQLDPAGIFRRAAADHDRAEFYRARSEVRKALEPLRERVERIDPSLGRTWEGTLAKALRAVDKLEERAQRAQLSQSGRSRQGLHALRNALLPRGRLQERMLPLPHFLNRHGRPFLQLLFDAGQLCRFDHSILTLEEADARG
ncbi:MAG: bacillithiol biosynthesis cysteine-adding enzyme BshC [Anaerolineae bacterium]|nr:bacillithiol biosynthesis cysteine-adding enzyme BshC [Anaerolineae bacterium]